MIRDRRDEREADHPSRSPAFGDDRDEDFDRDAAEERSRGAIRGAFPGLDTERHAELDRKRAKPLHVFQFSADGRLVPVTAQSWAP